MESDSEKMTSSDTGSDSLYKAYDESESDDETPVTSKVCGVSMHPNRQQKTYVSPLSQVCILLYDIQIKGYLKFVSGYLQARYLM